MAFSFFLLKRETKAFCVGLTGLKLEASVQRYKVRMQGFQLTVPVDICIPGFHKLRRRSVEWLPELI